MKKAFLGQLTLNLFVITFIVMLTACNNSSAPSVSSSSSGSDQPMTQDAYVEQVLENMNESLSDISSLTQMIISTKNDASNHEELVSAVENIRNAIEDLSKLTDLQPPVGWEDTHAKLVNSIQDFSNVNEAYCDFLMAGLNGESQSAATTIQQDMMLAVSAVMESLHELQLLAVD